MSTCELNSSNNNCIDKTCLTYRGSLSTTNCNNYFIGCTYYGNYDNTSSCTTTVRTCASAVTAHDNGYDIVDQSGCDSWKAGCAYRGSGNYGCEARSCSNYVSANQSNPTSYAQCNSWLSTCTFDSSNQICVEKTCSNFSQSSPSFANCQAWHFLCTINSTSTGCEKKNCTNYSLVYQVFNDPSCESWYVNCRANSSKTGCEASCTTIDQFNYVNQISQKIQRIIQFHFKLKIQQYQEIYYIFIYTTSVTPFNFENCQDWDTMCSVNSDNSNCERRSCSNPQLASYTDITCSSWLSTCTNNSNTGCIDRTCYNYSTNLLLYTANNCQSWLSTCTNYKTQGCILILNNKIEIKQFQQYAQNM